ncbi:MAG: PQQ-binding-like beta-propeller repeat protein [Pirellulales bacterium]|nr:PQQ-binding-like beta-propeller repeat protein [Pirellulales bacterium]
MTRFASLLVLSLAFTIGCTKPKTDGDQAKKDPAPASKTDTSKATDNTPVKKTDDKPVETKEPSSEASPPKEEPPVKEEPATTTTTSTETDNKPTGDWAQWGGSPGRNNVPNAEGIPSEWEVGEFDLETGERHKEGSKNIKWAAKLGSQSYGNPVVAGGKVFVGTNNGASYLERFPNKVDLGCLIAFNEADGKFLWQHSSRKLKSGRVHDWPQQGICCAPLVEGDRLWFVTSRGEVICADTEGFHDDENDGPFKDEEVKDKSEADVIWVYDMMKELGISQHNMCSCSVTAYGDILFVATGNGVDESHLIIPFPKAASFFALDKNTGELLWSDNAPDNNVLHGQWSSPAFAVLGGVPQVIFAGGDGWVYSYRGDRGKDGKPELLWKFDANPKTTKWILGGRGTRNNIISTPVIYDGKVFVAVGQDPEHGEGQGHLWCIDPTKRGDVSPTLAVKADDEKTIVPHRRIQAVEPEKGEKEIPNSNSAVIWHYMGADMNDDGEMDFEETMHRSCGTVAIKDGLLFIADFSGLFHCLDVETGKPHWTYDMLAAAWGSPLIVDGKVYIGDEDGDVAIFKLSKEKQEEPIEINMGTSVYSTPIVANGTLYISSRNWLFAIEEPKEEE